MIKKEDKTRSKEVKKEKIEREIVDVLLLLSSLPETKDIKKIFEILGKSSGNEIKKEFEVAWKQLKLNIKPEEVLEELKKRVGSNIFSRIVDVFLYSIKTGVAINKKMSEMADDLLSYLETKREKTAMLSIQKYTLMIGVILIGVISGKAYAIVDGIKSGSVEFMLKYVPAYIIINSSLVSWFSSSIEGNKSRAFLYMIALSSISIIMFFYIIGKYVFI